MLIQRISDSTSYEQREERRDLQLSLAILADLRERREQAELAFRAHEAYCVKRLEQAGLGSQSFRNGEQSCRATLVQSSDVRFNEVTLKKALGATVWNKVIKKSLDKAKLEQLVNEGEVDSILVAAHATVAPKKPYIRISVKEADDADA